MALSDYLAGVLGKIGDPEKRAQAEAILNDAAAAEALRELENGVLRQSDYSRSMDAARRASEEAEAARLRADAKYTENLDWYERNRQALEAAARGGQPAPTPQPTPSPAPATPGVLTQEEFDRRIDAFGRDALSVVAETNRIALSHYAQFGEALDVGQLMVEGMKTNKPLAEVYQTKFKDRLDAKAAEAEAARLADLKKTWEAEYRAAHPNLPYAVRPTMPETLDGLTAPDKGEYSAAAAADLYEQLAAGKA